MARLNPTAQAELERPRTEAEIFSAFVKTEAAKTKPFDVESTRIHFEKDLLKSYAPMGLSEEELRDSYLKRNPHFKDDYLDPHVSGEWIGWKNGILHGYELWGKK